MDAIRTPDSRFDKIADFPYEPHYREWQGLRMAHIDEGEGSPVLMIHGEPTWSYLYRKMIPPLVAAGHRCIAPDLAGFGRSDKPVDDDWYSFKNHAGSVVDLLEQLDLSGVTLVVQDWGGPLGLYAATIGAPERVDRIVAMDTGVFSGYQKMSDAWHHFHEFVKSNHDLPIEPLIKGAMATDPSDEVLAAYAAPFPDAESKAGPRTFPSLIPQTPDAPGAAEGQATQEALLKDERPVLLLWADSDPALPLEPVGRAVQGLFPTAEPLTVIENASHFLQEDQGDKIGQMIADWLD
jgi:haloalkane dehalogenase